LASINIPPGVLSLGEGAFFQDRFNPCRIAIKYHATWNKFVFRLFEIEVNQCLWEFVTFSFY